MTTSDNERLKNVLIVLFGSSSAIQARFFPHELQLIYVPESFTSALLLFFWAGGERLVSVCVL